MLGDQIGIQIPMSYPILIVICTLMSDYTSFPPFKAASVGFDDQNFHDFVRDPKMQAQLLEHLPIDGHLVPFHNWAQRADKKMY